MKATATVTVNEKSILDEENSKTTSQTVHIGGQHKLNCKYQGKNIWIKEWDLFFIATWEKIMIFLELSVFPEINLKPKSEVGGKVHFLVLFPEKSELLTF